MSMPPPPPPAGGNQPPSWQQQPAQPAYYQPQGPYPPQPGYQQQWQQQPPVMVRTAAPIGWVAAVLAAVCGAAPFLPWASSDGESVDGFTEFVFIDRRFAGVAVIFFAAIAAILLVIGSAVRLRVLHILGAVFVGLAALMPLGDLDDISDFNADPGVGLFVAIGAGAAACICAIVAAVQTKKRPAA